MKQTCILFFLSIICLVTKAQQTYASSETIFLEKKSPLMFLVPDSIFQKIDTWKFTNSNATIINDTIISNALGENLLSLFDKNETIIAEISLSIQEYIPVDSIQTNTDTLHLAVGDSSHIEYSVYPSNASVNKISWISSQPAIAQILETGEVKALQFGYSKIFITTYPSKLTKSIFVDVKQACNLESPTVLETVDICMNEKALLLASSNNIIWYKDSSLTKIAGTGAFFSPQYSEPNTYEFYAVQYSDECTSPPAKAVLKVSPIPEPPNIEHLPTVIFDKDIDTIQLQDSCNWYSSLEDATAFLSGKHFPSGLELGNHTYSISTIDVCESTKTEYRFKVIEKPKVYISGEIHSLDNTQCTIQLINAQTNKVVSSIENIENQFELTVYETGIYKLKAVPMNSDKYLPTYFGNTNTFRSAHTLKIDSLNIGSIDIHLLSNDETNVITNMPLLQAQSFTLFDMQGIIRKHNTPISLLNKSLGELKSGIYIIQIATNNNCKNYYYYK